MKHEILKKTLLYRLLAYGVTILINIASPLGMALSILFATISEVTSLIIYYVYEYYWRKMIDSKNLKKGTNILMIQGNGKISIAYNVLEVLDDNKFVIDVI